VEQCRLCRESHSTMEKTFCSRIKKLLWKKQC